MCARLLLSVRGAALTAASCVGIESQMMEGMAGNLLLCTAGLWLAVG